MDPMDPMDPWIHGSHGSHGSMDPMDPWIPWIPWIHRSMDTHDAIPRIWQKFKSPGNCIMIGPGIYFYTELYRISARTTVVFTPKS